MADNKHKGVVVTCGARCIFQRKGKCKSVFLEKSVAAVIGHDGKCVRFETSEEK